MRTSIDLYASFFAISVMLAILALYVSYRKVRLRRSLVVLQVLFVLMLLSYWFLWLFSAVTLLIAELIFAGGKNGKIKQLAAILLPSALTLCAFVLVANAYRPPSYWGFGSSFVNYLGVSVTPAGTVTQGAGLTLSNTYFRLLTGDGNALLPIFAAFGLASYRPRSFP